MELMRFGEIFRERHPIGRLGPDDERLPLARLVLDRLLERRQQPIRRHPLRRLHDLTAFDADLTAQVRRHIEILQVEREVQVAGEGARQLEPL